VSGSGLTRRHFVGGVLASCAVAPVSLMTTQALADQDPDDPFQLPPFDEKKLPKDFRRAVVPYPTRHWPGTVIINTGNRQLFIVLEGQQAMRFGCAVGRDGFRWAGLADVGRKVMWPRWTPPKDMIERSPEKAKWKDGMPGGPQNPLGARALYLFQNGNDTLYRIHGTNEPMSIGKNASSGCIRMLNQDVIELYRRAPVGTRVVVMAEGW
jgi:lipoprotein-anchoring transpeptidase ErfK/SrfK